MAEYQHKLAGLIKDYEAKGQASVIPGKASQGSIFIVGDQRAGAIHSEPYIHSDRLFVSVVTGTKQQIKELESRHDDR